MSCVRYAKTNWTIPTDSQGRFQVYAPLDAELVAQDNAGRTFSRKYASAGVGLCVLQLHGRQLRHDPGSLRGVLSNIVQQMTWEFPIGYQLSASYVRTNLTGDAVMTNFSIVSTPPFTSGKTNSEIAVLLVDKTQVQPGDTVNYAVIYRSPKQPPTDRLEVEWKGWDTNHPQIFTKYNLEFVDDNNPATLINLGNGFYLRQGSAVVPPWAANVTDSTAAMEMYATVRTTGGAIAEDAQVLLRVGPTQRALLVSSTSDGLPASWGEIGIGPCNFRRDYTDFLVRYSDYRNMVVNLTLNGQPITLNPKVDTAHVADADDSVFYEQFYYDGQCEPQYRNVPFRDPVRAQPPSTDFSTVPIQNPPDTTPPNVVAIEPPNVASVPAGTNLFYFLVDDEGLSGPASATVYVDGAGVASTSTNPVALNVTQGNHTWQVEGFDVAGNSAFSPLISFTVGPGSTNPPPLNTVWVDDLLPAGANPDSDGGDSWNWVTNNPTPLSGTLANQSSIATEEHEHLFTNATTTLPVSSNDTLFAYIYLDPVNIPSEVMLQWNDGSWEHRAFWGSNAIALGTSGTGSRLAMGALPPGGQWTKLSVPAQQVGLTNSNVNGLALTLFGGRATWDYIGKTSGTPTNPPSPGNIIGTLSNGLWQARVTNSGSWLYTLERSTNLQDWTPLSSQITPGSSTLQLQDSNPPLPDAFYRFHVQSP